MEPITIRMAEQGDAAALVAIYAPYVEQTAITYEYVVPTVEEFAGRIEKILRHYPYLVAERDGEIVGYAYAGRFHERAAFAWDVETTVYVRGDQRKTGVGRRLYAALEEILARQNIRNLYACIAYPEEEDQFLTRNSVRFHTRLGYRCVGEFPRCAYKFDRWYGMVWMEKRLREDQEPPRPVRPLDEVREEITV